MKKLLGTFILVSLCSLVGMGQTNKDKQAIEIALKDLQGAIMNWDVEKMLYYTPPKIFSISSEVLIRGLLKNNAEQYSVRKIETKKIYPIILYNQTKYALAEYSGYVVPNLSEEEKKQIDKTVTRLRLEVGEQNVILNKAKTQISILQTWEVCAILAPKTKGWKFLQMSTDKMFLNALLPEEVQQKLSAQKND